MVNIHTCMLLAYVIPLARLQGPDSCLLHHPLQPGAPGVCGERRAQNSKLSLCLCPVFLCLSLFPAFLSSSCSQCSPHLSPSLPSWLCLCLSLSLMSVCLSVWFISLAFIESLFLGQRNRVQTLPRWRILGVPGPEGLPPSHCHSFLYP